MLDLIAQPSGLPDLATERGADDIRRGAHISADELYRYWLFRMDALDGSHPVKPCLLILLNPSVADAFIDDPTVRRAAGFAVREGCTALMIVNLFAYRATNPAVMAAAADPIGPANDEILSRAVNLHRAHGLVIVGWGAHEMAKARAKDLQFRMRLFDGAMCLGTNKDGSPKHPLYLPKNAPLTPWLGYKDVT